MKTIGLSWFQTLLWFGCIGGLSFSILMQLVILTGSIKKEYDTPELWFLSFTLGLVSLCGFGIILILDKLDTKE